MFEKYQAKNPKNNTVAAAMIILEALFILKSFRLFIAIIKIKTILVYYGFLYCDNFSKLENSFFEDCLEFKIY